MAGRPTKFKGEYVEQVEKLCRLGATDEDLARFFDVDRATITNWKQKHTEFLTALKAGKEFADANVADSLYRRATGYSHDDTHISNYQGAITKTDTVKHYPPDTTACIFWLKNRRPDLWRDRHEHTGKDGEPLMSQEMTNLELAQRIVFMLEQAGRKVEADDETVH